MIKEIKMPSAGQTTDTALVTKWLVSKGDIVKRGDLLLEVETDKAVLPVESYTDGIIIDILVSENETVSSGDILALIGNKKDLEEASNQPIIVNSSSKAEAFITPQKISEGDEYIQIIKEESKESACAKRASTRKTYLAMPNAKKLARETGIDLTNVIPLNGKVIKQADVQLFINKNISIKDETKEYEIIPMSRMRQTIARRMTDSMQTIPAFHITIHADATKLIALKDDIYKTYDTIKVSYTDIVMKSVAVVGKEYRMINARFENDELRLYQHTNIGLAVAIDGGLVVPVVKNTEEKSIIEIAKVNQNNIKNAREGKLSLSELGTGSITISNLGMFDIDHFAAIINPPESCILALGSITTAPVWTGTEWRPIPKMSITGSFDHRFIDGAYGAEFMKALKNIIENPVMMLC
jgi:pyruvate dehydrogenase E2 component (dihydrolipoamide acetyltransferase)